MKKMVCAFALLMTLQGFCQWNAYDVHFEDHSDRFEFFVKTVEDQPSMGALVIYDLSVTLGEDCFPGKISMRLHMDPDTASLPAIGPRTGHFVFPKGKELPNIPDGAYEIVIDDVSYGQMFLDPDVGSYHPLENATYDQ